MKKTALVLGGGGARGWAHIGVIQALNEQNIPITHIAGTSIGALVGAFFAAGTLDILRKNALEIDWKKTLGYLDPVLPKSGLIRGHKITSFIRQYLGVSLINEAAIPFCAVATDLISSREVVFSHGDMVEAVRASISIPGIFTPVKNGDSLLVDGGLINPLPVDVARNMGADQVIAVDLNSTQLGHSLTAEQQTAGQQEENASDNPGKEWRTGNPNRKEMNIFEILTATTNIIEVQITRAKLAVHPPELLISPNLGHIDYLEFTKAEAAISIGYDEARRCLETAGWR